MTRSLRAFVMAATLLAASSSLVAQYDLNWHTVDGGGHMWSTGGQFALGGTIGQPDASAAGAMSGGSFTLVGGFWAAAADTCGCSGDLNHDCTTNALDIQGFVTCVIAGGSCAAADMDGSGQLDMADVAPFVAKILAAGACP